VLQQIPVEVRVAWQPPENLTVSQWAEKYRVLLPETSSEPGPWRNSRTPYLASIMDAFSDPYIEKIVFNKGSQLGGTEALYCMLGYAIHQDPAPALFVMPTLDLARYASRKRIQPMINASPVLRERKPANDDDFSILEMLFPGMVLTLAGANSPASLASRPCRYVFLDEVNKFPKFSGKEADPISLATERQKTFWNRKTVIISTPTIEDGQITRELSICDVVYDYHVPCPHCGKMQTLKFGQIKWPESLDRQDAFYPAKVRAAAWYACEACGRQITDMHRPQMIGAGEWRPRGNQPLSPRSVGFHLPSFYSPWLGWGDIAEVFVKSQPFGEKLMNVVNSWFAEPWKRKTEDRKESSILALKDDRPRGLVPSDGVLALTCGVDTQDNGWYYVVRAWGNASAGKLESWLVREGFVDTEEALEQIIYGRYQDIKNQDYVIQMTLIDAMGHRTAEVYEFCRSRIDVKPIRGEQRMALPYGISIIEFFPNSTKPIPGGLKLYRLNSNYYKDKLHGKLLVNPADPGAFHLHAETTEEYARHMTAEFRNDHGLWECPQGRHNHYWDCEYLALAATDILNLQHWHQPQQVSTQQSNHCVNAQDRINKPIGNIHQRINDAVRRRVVNPWAGRR
jgi:phage terminase large subunit GpA-like protein